MKNSLHKILLAWCCILTATACNSSSTDAIVTDDTSSVTVNGAATGTSEGVGLMAVENVTTIEEPAENLFVNVYAFCMAESDDCSAVDDEDWVCIFDNTDDISSCTEGPSLATAQADFLDIISNPELGANDSVEAGDYNCVRVTMCDQLVGVSEGLVEQCGETINMDVYGEDEELAEVADYYWSVSGSNDDPEEEGDERGSAETPFLLEEQVSLAAGTEVTLTLNMSNDDDGWVAQYVEEWEECDIPAPNMVIEQE